MFNNPVLNNFSNLSAYIIFWFLLAVINFVVLFYGSGLEFKYAVADSIIFTFVLALFSLSFWYSAKYISFEKNSLFKIIFSHLAGSIAASTIWIGISYFILINIFSEISYIEFLNSSVVWRFLFGIIFYFSITSLYYVIIYYNELREKNTREAELRNQVTRAELKTLKFQINPHFIFNSLNSISALTLTDPAKARAMTLKISDFLRYSLSNNERQTNSLSEELNNLKLYLDIEKVRFEDKIVYSEDIPDECLNIEVPNMIMQPLIENVVKHSVYEAAEKIDITLVCRKESDLLTINLLNNYENEGNFKKGPGVGLKNISGRLELLYSRKDLLEIKDEGGIFSVKLFIPIQNQ